MVSAGFCVEVTSHENHQLACNPSLILHMGRDINGKFSIYNVVHVLSYLAPVLKRTAA